MHLPAYVAKGDTGFIAYDGAPWRALCDYVKDRYPRKSRRLVRSIEWVVAVGLMLIESPGITFTG
jgi:hypothetical protein